MSHDPKITPPVGKSPTPRRKSVRPPEQDPASGEIAAEAAFKAAHEAAFQAPSGEARFHIHFSENPAHWRYEATTSIGKPFGFDPPNASMRTTDVTIRACIPSRYLISSQPCYQTLAKASRPLLKIAIGAEIIEPPHPAEAAWIIHMVNQSYHAERYGGIYHKALLLSLGEHSTLVSLETKAPGETLTEHIRQVSIKRLQGPEPLSAKPTNFVFADEVSAWRPA